MSRSTPRGCRSLLTALLFCLTALALYGQPAQQKDTLGTVTGRVSDPDGVPARGVTLRLLAARDSALVTGAISDSLGRYRLTRVPMGSYVMCYSMVGFQTGFVNLTVTAEKPAVDVPTIRVELLDVMLNAAVVTASLPPVTVINDTVAYNADAIPTPEGAMVEDLVERLPGAEITEDGKIKINGKEYDRILVNGREFFGNDPQMALKNLPANIVKRIKTYDRKSAQARLTGIDDGEEHNVIDIEVKPNMFKGWVGQASGALGNHDRYSTALNLNRFRREEHLSIMGGMNNVNNPGFSERGRDAMNFSRGSRSGLTAAKSAGINYARDKKDKYRVAGNLRYGYSNAENRSSSHSETVYNDSNFRYNDNQNHSVRRRYEVSSDVTLEWKPDTLTNIHVRPNFSYYKTENWSTGLSTAERWDGRAQSDTTAINRRQSGNASNAEGSTESVSIGINRRLSRKGRSVSVNTSFSYTAGISDSYSRNLMKYYLQASRNRNYNRHSDSDNYSTSRSAGFTYNEPVYKGGFVQLRYNYSHRHSRQNRYGYELDRAEMDTILVENEEIDWTSVPVDTALSSVTANTYISHSLNVNMRHTSPTLNVSYGVNLNPRHNETNYIFGPKMDKGLITQDLMNWSPTLTLRYKFNKRTSATLNYRGTSSEPNIDNLQEVIDKTNPQNVRYGNPQLKPSFTHAMNANFNGYGEKSHRSLVTNWSFASENNHTSNMVLYESATGVRVSKLMNVDGNWNMSGNVSFNTPIDSLERVTLSTYSGAAYHDNTNYNSTPLTQKDLMEAGIVADFQELSPDDVDRLQPYALKNHTHTLRLRQNLSIRYRRKGFSTSLTGGVGYYKVENSIQTANKRETFDYSLRGNIQIELPMKVQLSTDMNFTSRHGYSANIQKNIALWNGQISKRFLKRNAGLVTFQIYDLLHQRSTVTRDISNLTITDTRAEALRDYFMIGFQYRLNNVGRQGRQNR